jgi:hypothetical protein
MTYEVDRRDFLKAGAIAACGLSQTLFGASGRHIGIVVDPSNGVASGQVAGWAVSELRRALSARGLPSVIVTSASEAGAADFFVVLADGNDPHGPSPAAPERRMNPESLRLEPRILDGRPAVWLSAVDPRGFVYGLLELADRVRLTAEPSHALMLSRVIEETPANAVRSAARLFVSETEDKPWYYDKSFWSGYLDLLASSRFNRFSLTFGLGYDFPRGVTGDYFQFPYPYLVEVPGYSVRVVPLDDAERDRNLEALQFIAAETAARGIQFQLGLWRHAYQWTDSPHSDHNIEGLTPATHAAYCRDALALLLKKCPQVGGITLRVHGESGIPEGSYSFWQTLFEAFTGSGRQIEIDMHAKGIDQKMIDIAAATGMPIKVSPKFSAEHMGLGYHQADIRELEWPLPDATDKGTFALSSGSRRFLRYGYGDLFQEGKSFNVLFRLWPGTQHILLMGDPATAAAYGRMSSFCGAAGLEIFEPLTFKGRQGSGIAGSRCAYLDESLDPGKDDWQKFEYTYRVWGRCLYNPNTESEVWKRFLRKSFGAATESAHDALANASRVLPLITTSHLPSASNQSYWPELYTNMVMIAAHATPPYPDTPDPKCFGTVSPLDPQLFSNAVEFAQSLLRSHASAKYSPADVAQWLETFTDRSSQALARARTQAPSTNRRAFKQLEEDVLIYIGLGRFFAGKMRSAILLEIHLQTGNQEAGELAVAALTNARNSWASMAIQAKAVYRPDVTYGQSAHLRGDWMSRLPAIDSDLAAVRDKVKLNREQAAEPRGDASAALAALAVNSLERPSVTCSHGPATAFRPGIPLPILLSAPEGAPLLASVSLWFRHVNQAERWSSRPMERIKRGFESSIPAECTASPFSLQYYFELHPKTASSRLYPGFNEALSNQPYYVITRRIV